MNCKEFKKFLTPKTPTLYPYKINVLIKDANYKHHIKWMQHMFGCLKCEDAYMRCSLQRKRVKDISKYSCIHIPYHLANEDHYLINSKDSNQVGFKLPDWGPTSLRIKYCPWCGKKIVIKKKGKKKYRRRS